MKGKWKTPRKRWIDKEGVAEEEEEDWIGWENTRQKKVKYK